VLSVVVNDEGSFFLLHGEQSASVNTTPQHIDAESTYAPLKNPQRLEVPLGKLGTFGFDCAHVALLRSG